MAQEAEAIRRAFPELRESRGPRRREDVAEQESGGESGTSTGGRRPHSTMTAAQHKAVGERIKKYWAARRAGTAITPAAAVEANESPNGKVARAAKGAKPGTAKRGFRKVSAAARKRMSQAQKKRWAAKRKAA